MDINDLLANAQAALGLENASPLTQGGQKIVLKGTLSGAPAVAKVVVLQSGANHDITIERAHREVELLATVDSDFVVKVLSDVIEIGEPLAALCWVEECLDGVDVGALLSSIWDEDEVWRLLANVATGLAACHELEVVHRDLSPGNIRRTSTGQFVLMDPGLARHLAKTALTGYYQPGTPGWRSPEHVPGGDPTPASDVFALGILAYFALTMTYAIDPTGNPTEYDRRLVESQALPLARVAAGVDPDLAQIVDRCLQRQPARRFLDGGELIKELTSAGRFNL